MKGAASLRLFDRNFNQLAAAGPVSSDGIAWSDACSGDGSVAFTVSDQFMEQISPGILLSADTGAAGADPDVGVGVRVSF